MTDIEITAGKSFNKQIRVVDAKNVWATLDVFEIRAQLRTGPDSDDLLVENLHDFMTEKAFDTDPDHDKDLLITWRMTGADTQALYDKEWGFFHRGYFNIAISDIGTTDSRSLVSRQCELVVHGNTTKPSGAT